MTPVTITDHGYNFQIVSAATIVRTARLFSLQPLKVKLRGRVVPLCQFQSSSSGQVLNSGTSQTGQISCEASAWLSGRNEPRIPSLSDRNQFLVSSHFPILL